MFLRGTIFVTSLYPMFHGQGVELYIFGLIASNATNHITNQFCTHTHYIKTFDELFGSNIFMDSFFGKATTLVKTVDFHGHNHYLTVLTY